MPAALVLRAGLHSLVRRPADVAINDTVWSWDRLAEICGTYLGKGQQVAVEGRLQTRSWDDDRGARHWKTEVVATHVEMLSGRRKKDYEAETAADALAAQANAMGELPADTASAFDPVAESEPGEVDDEVDDEAA